MSRNSAYHDGQPDVARLKAASARRFLLTDTYRLQNDETEPHDGHTAKHAAGLVLRIDLFASGISSSTERYHNAGATAAMIAAITIRWPGCQNPATPARRQNFRHAGDTGPKIAVRFWARRGINRAGNRQTFRNIVQRHRQCDAETQFKIAAGSDKVAILPESCVRVCRASIKSQCVLSSREKRLLPFAPDPADDEREEAGGPARSS